MKVVSVCSFVCCARFMALTVLQLFLFQILNGIVKSLQLARVLRQRRLSQAIG